MIDLHTQLLTIVGTVIVITFVLFLLVPALEHWRWSRSRRGRGGRYVR